MSLCLDDGDVRLYHGDALETLRTLPSRSVDMVATSPPFYGLRDYGTGEWEGGDDACDHIAPPRGGAQGGSTKSGLNAKKDSDGRLDADNKSHQITGIRYANVCRKCGARRIDRQIGLEETPDQWVANLVQVFRECRRVLADHGTLWVEIGDSYTSSGNGGDTKSGFNSRYFGIEDTPQKQNSPEGLVQHRRPGKPKDLLGQPWLLAFALRADGWYLRSEIIWARPNPMPESVTDRPTKAHSTVFLLSKQPRYFYDADAIREPHADTNVSRQAALQKHGTSTSDHAVSAAVNPDSPYANQRAYRGLPGVGTQFSGYNPAGANARSVWNIPTQPTPFAHFATWPQKLVGRMIQAGTSERGRCPECGGPWVRETVETDEYREWKQRENGWAQRSGDLELGRGTGGKGTNSATVPPKTQMLGWSPSCGHDTTPTPCTVLDPFAGSGTTLLAARNHQRHAIGIELNPDYCAIAATRLQQLSLLT